MKKLFEIYKQHPTITTDSRDVPQGSLFFALKGESFNGNKFAVAALDKGAAYSIIDEADIYDQATAEQREHLILVDDVLQTFKDLAREHRRQFHIPVIGITGTNGKTTTKELVAAVLSQKYNVMYTLGNFNNDVGVPKTLFRLTPEHDIAVVEMGASHPGDIKTLVETAEPTCGMITNVGRAHLQGFGSFEGVKNTKAELYDFISAHDAFAFLNTNDADLCEMAQSRSVATVPYVEGTVTKCDPFLHVHADGLDIHLQLVGTYNLPNILAAITIGRHFGVSDEQITHALESYTPSNNRSQLTVTQHNHLVVDAYNANPTSMAAAIDNFQRMEVSGRKIAILGDMRELGAASAEEHQKVIHRLSQAHFDEVWLVGEEFGKTTHPFRHFPDVEAVKSAITEKQPEGCYILIKGSNGIKLFQLPEML